MAKILYVDESDEGPRLLVERGDWEITHEASGEAAAVHLESECVDVVVVDAKLWQDETFRSVVERLAASVPVVILTNPDEPAQNAVAMLRLGAVTFVPRSLLEQDLHATIDAVVGIAKRHATRERLSGILVRSDCSLEVPNELALIPRVVGFLQGLVYDFGICERRTLMGIGMALREALSNAMIHGNLEIDSDLRLQGGGAYYEEIARRAGTDPYAGRHIAVEATVSSSAATFIVRDEGPGFDLDEVPDPTAAGNLQSPGGRGILLMRSYSDLVSWNDAGNEVTLVKRV